MKTERSRYRKLACFSGRLRSAPNFEHLEPRRVLASVSGFAFVDADGDGQRNLGELGIPGIVIQLESQDASVLRSTMTSDQGFYAFRDVPAGDYSVRQQPPEATIDDAGIDLIEGIQLADNQDLTDVNFAEGLIKPQYASIQWLFASSANQKAPLFRQVIADAEAAAGNQVLADLVRSNAERDAVTSPLALADQYVVTSGDVLQVAAESGVLSNDVNPSELTLSTLLVDAPENGSLLLNADGSFTYEADANFVGTDRFSYTSLSDSSSANVATVLIEVEPPPNVPPEPVVDTYTIAEDTPLIQDALGGVLANDVDAGPLTARLVDDVQHGSLVLNSDGSFRYVPDADFFGADQFGYIAEDGEFSAEATLVTLDVTPVPDAPVAGDDAYQTDQGVPLSVSDVTGVLANDVDAEQDIARVELLDDVANGQLTLETSGAFTYVPDATFFGTDTFSYRAFDATGLSDVAIVSIVVISSGSNPPDAVNDSYVLDEDTTLTVAAELGVLANDSDPDQDALTVGLIADVQNGTLTLSTDGSFEYTPTLNFFGEDTFIYEARDGQLTTNATVTIAVAPVNDAPVANDDRFTVNQDETLVIQSASGVLANDNDADDDVLTAILVNEPSNGQLTLGDDGELTYVPNSGFLGEDEFSYRATDGMVDSDIATVTIDVLAVNNPPVTAVDSYSIDQDDVLTVDANNGLLGNDMDPDGDPLTVRLETQPANGGISLNEDGSFTYTPISDFDGTDSFSYVANDGTEDSAPTAVTITVNPVIDTVSEQMTLGPSKDNSLFESADGSLSNGVGEYLFVGKTLQSENFLRRGLIAFDFSSIPANATITSVSLRLNMSRTIVGAFDVELRRALTDWGEGDSDAPLEEGTGVESATGDATWLHTFYNTGTWNTPGGDFAADLSATTSVDGGGFYIWTSPQMVADVQAWLADPDSNAGWFLITDEVEISAKRFDSRENSNVDNRPQLVVDYDYTPAGTSATAMAAAAVLAEMPGLDVDEDATAEGLCESSLATILPMELVAVESQDTLNDMPCRQVGVASVDEFFAGESSDAPEGASEKPSFEANEGFAGLRRQSRFS